MCSPLNFVLVTTSLDSDSDSASVTQSGIELEDAVDRVALEAFSASSGRTEGESGLVA